MCGIAAMHRTSDTARVAAMLARIRHRGPDDAGVTLAFDSTLGHVRLSIIDAPGGAQPMWSFDRSTCLVYNGEIYNYLELRASMSDTRHFSTSSDTEVLLAAIERYGISAPSILDGMFAFVAMRGGELIAARDRLGIKPLYMALESDGSIVFASERKAFSTRADIQEFPAGHVFSSASGLQPFYRLAPFPVIKNDEHSILESVRTLLDEAVRKRLVADVPVGVLLSGGLDSSIVAALMRRRHPLLHSFAAGCAGAPDLAAARDVAAALGTIHHEAIFTADEMIRVLPDVIYFLESFDLPLVRSALPNYFVARLARNFVKVVLTGEGADELFAGYKRYEALERGADLARELLDDTTQLHNTNLQRTDRMTMAFSIEARVPFLDTALVEYAHGIPAELRRNEGHSPSKRLLREAFRHLLPEHIVWREKEKFSVGAGSAEILAAHAERTISDFAFIEEAAEAPVVLRSKEELLYYRLYVSVFGRPSDQTEIGRTTMSEV